MYYKVNTYSQYCPRCGSHYLEDIGESCRCQHPDPEATRPEVVVWKELLSKCQVGTETL